MEVCLNQPCITWFNSSLRIEKLVLNGLEKAPEVIENENKIVIKNDNISIELKYSGISVNSLSYVLEM
jgi:hypothetical protein